MQYENIETILELTVPESDETIDYRVWFDFTYTAGYPVNKIGHPDNWCEGIPDDYEITRIQIEISDGIWCGLNQEHWFLYEDKLIEAAIDFINEESAK